MTLYLLYDLYHYVLVQKPFVYSWMIAVNAEECAEPRIAIAGVRTATYSSVKLSRDN